MAAIDTISTFATNPGAGPAAAVVSPGDSLVVRNFGAPSTAELANIFRRGATAGFARVRSPRLHDNVTGINFKTAETVSTLTLPNQLNQPLYANDALIVELSGGAAETDAAILSIYYQQLDGASARLNSWGDIAGLVKNVKSFQTVVANSATIGTWTDTVITTTENQLHADSDYAVLGYLTDTVQSAVGVKGQDTGNLRVCGPGSTIGLDTSDWFIRLSESGGFPAIPVLNANNRAGISVSTVDVVASSTPTVTLILAELSARAPH